MKYVIRINRKSQKNIDKMPVNVGKLMALLICDLSENGPIQKEWSKFSRLGENEYHCHLSYHWVACWRCEKNSILIEVYYAGSRENAPY